MIETWKAWAMFAFGVVIGSVLIYLWPWPLLFVATKKDWVDVLTAFGTLGAVVVAVSLAIWQHTKDRDQGRDLGIIAAATLRQRVVDMRALALDLGDIFNHVAQHGPFDRFEAQARSLLDAMESTQPLSPAEILQTVGVSKACALSLATGNGAFIDAVSKIRRSIGMLEAGNERLQRVISEDFAKSLKPAYRGLDIALEGIDEALRSFKLPSKPFFF